MNIEQLRGDWALVTGASSGIGREFCVQLAERGLRVAMVARREDRLQALQAELGERFGAQTLVLVQDLAAGDATARILARLQADEIVPRLVVNCAALGRWGRFEDGSVDEYAAMLQVNVTALVCLTRGLLPLLAKRTPSVLINLSSGAAYQPVPFMAAYAASKAFVHAFSQALYGEWAGRGVLVQTLVPGPTATEFDDVAGAYASAVGARGTPAEVVRDALAALRGEAPMAVNARGVWKQRVFAGLLPPRMVIAEVAKMFRPPA